MKGQYLTIEYVLFFAIGIAMVVAVFYTFTTISNSTKTDASTVQMEKTGELIRDSIVNVYETGNRTNSTINYKLDIPPKLSGQVYTVQYITGLNVNSTENYKIGSTLSLYNINIKPSAIIYSTKGEVQIRYNCVSKQVELL